MEGISTSSLASLCSVACQRSTSTANESSRTASTLLSHNNNYNSKYDAKILELTSVSLRVLSRNLEMLLESLTAAQNVSNQMQRILSQSLRKCACSTDQLRERLFRLEDERENRIQPQYLKTYRASLTAQSSLFLYLADILSRTNIHDQDARLTSPGGRHILGKVHDAVQAVPDYIDSSKIDVTVHTQVSDDHQKNGRDLREGALMGTASEYESPPPYTPGGAESSYSELSRSKPALETSADSKQKSITSTFTKCLQAVASVFQPSTDPLVSATCRSASCGNIQQVASFLSQGAHIDGLNEDGETALGCSLSSRQFEISRLLIESGASVNGPVGWSKLPPIYLAASVGSVEIAELLMEKGARLQDDYADTYFLDVVSSQSIEGVQFLLENGANPNAMSVWGELAITLAVKKGNSRLARVLLDHGANVNGSVGEPLVIAVKDGRTDLLDLLLSKRANPNSTDSMMKYVLVTAIFNKRLDLARRLLAAGADLNIVHGQGLLIEALKSNKLTETERVEAAQMLLEYGAPVNTTNADYPPAICHALKGGIIELIILILLHKPTLKDLKMDSGETLLTYAIGMSRRELVMLLVTHGADPNEKDSKGRTSVQVALVRKDFDMVRLLLEAGADAKSTREAVETYARGLSNPDTVTSCGLI